MTLISSALERIRPYSLRALPPECPHLRKGPVVSPNSCLPGHSSPSETPLCSARQFADGLLLAEKVTWAQLPERDHNLL
jgi:hypothetical protein